MSDREEFSLIVKDKFPLVEITDELIDYMYNSLMNFRKIGYEEGYLKAMIIADKVGDINTSLIMRAMGSERLN